MSKRVAVFAMVCLVMLRIASPTTAYANAGPPVSMNDGDAVFFLPIKHESIEVVSESLTYDMKVSGKEEAYAEVEAAYELRNSSSEAVTTLVAFVANNPSAGVTVTIDGEAVGLKESKTMPWNVSGRAVYVEDLLTRSWSNVGLWTPFGAWAPTFEEILRFAGAGERKGDTNAGYDFELSLFELEFAAGRTRTLRVKFTEKAVVIKQRKGYKYVNPTAEFYYFLEPARYWKSFSDLTVTIKAPAGIPVETSLEGFRSEGNIYSARFEALPEQNLRIVAVLDPPGLAHALASALPWAAALAVILAIVALSKRLKRART